MKLAENATAFSDTDQPGIYRLHVDGEDRPFAVNLAAAESNTAPMDLESLEQLGVRFSTKLSRVERAEQVRQQRDTELESRQHLWRWLIVAAIALLILETYLAGRAARKLQTDLSTTSSGVDDSWSGFRPDQRQEDVQAGKPDLRGPPTCDTAAESIMRTHAGIDTEVCPTDKADTSIAAENVARKQEAIMGDSKPQL